MHAVWKSKSKFSNAITQPLDIERVCDPIYDKFGTTGEGGYYACQSALQLCIDSPTQCNEANLWETYSQALTQGYSADFQTFKRRSSLAGYLTAAGQIIQGFFHNKEQAPAPGSTLPEPMKKDNTLAFVIGGVALVGLGVGIYFLTRKKGK